MDAYLAKMEEDPAAMKASVERGKALFLGDRGKCVTCHLDYGRQSLFKFDAWGTLVRPANLTNAVYRGGRRPIDLYWRIHSGINGSGMIRFPLSDEEIWDVVHFVRALPYPGMMKRYGIDIH
jgi:mono/diheme cytochrome c family protein